MGMEKTVIIDYGMGNLGSIHNMLKRIGAMSSITNDPLEIERADRLILPGVGSFDVGMRNLKQGGFIPLLEEVVMKRQTPILGICLGMQLFTKSSEEGSLDGLGWVDAQTVRFKFDKDAGQRVPHMGWNTLRTLQEHPITGNLGDGSRFYFVHSFHIECHLKENVLASTDYGYSFPSVIHHNNIVGVQFHPEKSHRYGMQLLKNFVDLS